MRLASSAGELVRGRCRATNLCGFCARAAARETAELLADDAERSGGPAVWSVLGTRTVEYDPQPFYRAREAVVRALRRRWPELEYACAVEFTTGYGPRAGGERRPHWNLLWKNVAGDELPELAAITRKVWCGRVDAAPERQYAGRVHDAGGLSRYLALHFLKESQQPPLGWRGHRFLVSRGYFAGDLTRDRRRDARRRLAVHGAAARLRAEHTHLTTPRSYELGEELVAARAGDAWRLVFLSPEQLRDEATSGRSRCGSSAPTSAGTG